MTIIDKRKAGKNQSADNRQRFIKRYKKHIKKAIDDVSQDDSITDTIKNRKIKIPAKDLSEPDFSLDPNTGRKDIVLPGNKTLQRGDKIDRPKQGQGQSGNGGSDSGEGEDEFTFVLTKEEFFDIYFSDMALPNFIKESFKDTKKFKYKRCGYTRDGIPARMDLMKTFKQSLSRRIATRESLEEEGKKPRFLDDVDLRYKHFVKKPEPITHARIFFLMDVSYSMGETEKLIAKKFFMLLYLFLYREYEKIELTFVRHTHEADVVTEDEFFHSTKTGGTVVSSGLELINSIIDTEITLSETNVYVAQASDGDNFTTDDKNCIDQLVMLIDKVQYFAYIQVEDARRFSWKNQQSIEDLFDLYAETAKENKKFNIQRVHSPEDVYPVLKELFKKE
jgi:hypothetical protein